MGNAAECKANAGSDALIADGGCGRYAANIYTYYYWYSITHSLIHPRLKTFLFCKSLPP